jgi:hypothetical protein
MYNVGVDHHASRPLECSRRLSVCGRWEIVGATLMRDVKVC